MSPFTAADKSRTPSASGDSASQVRVMIVDDGLVIRGMLTRILEAEGDFSVVASAGDGQRALAALKRTPVDVVILDIEMPVMDGMTALPQIVATYPNVKVVMASTLTERNAEISLEALHKGASDYITKPGSSGALNNAEEFKRELVSKVRALGGKPAASAAAQSGRKPFRASSSVLPHQDASIKLRPERLFRPDVIAIGSSTGGPQALVKVIEDLGKVEQPILITQHMPPTFTRILAQHLNRAGEMPCKEAEEGDLVEPGHIYLAPGDRHMLVVRDGMKLKIKINDGPPENYCRPSVDPMLRSIVAVYGARILTVMLTGMGSDGAKGSVGVVEAGGQVIAQDEATSIVWGMPGDVAKEGLCSAIVPLNAVGSKIKDYAGTPASIRGRA